MVGGVVVILGGGVLDGFLVSLGVRHGGLTVVWLGAWGDGGVRGFWGEVVANVVGVEMMRVKDLVGGRMRR